MADQPISPNDLGAARYWDAIAPVEEADRGDEWVNRALRWREIERHLGGVETVLDVGGGGGVFSVPLAARGLRVTQVDVSSAMLDRAAARAAAAGVTVELVLGDARDLGRFAERSFDLVLNLDGAISFSGRAAVDVIRESCRVTRGTLIATASNKATMVATWIAYSMRAAGRILPAVHAMLRDGLWHKDALPDNALIYPAQCDIEELQAFTPVELAAAIEQCGLQVAAARSLGSLTQLLGPHGELAVPDAELLELADALDREVLPAGPGTFGRAGVLAVAHAPGGA